MQHPISTTDTVALSYSFNLDLDWKEVGALTAPQFTEIVSRNDTRNTFDT
jgi:hypothetical protein